MTATTVPLDLFAPEHVDDPAALFERLRRTAAVHRVPGTSFHLVSTWDLVQEAVARTEDFSSELRSVILQGADGAATELGMDGGGTIEQVLATADDPSHKLHRGLVLQTLGKRIRALDQDVTAFAGELWEAHARDGHVDWADAMADRLPLAMVARLIGLPEADVPRLLDLAYESTELLGGIVAADRMDRLVAASIELYGYLAEHFDRARRHPGDDLLGTLAAACADGGLQPETAVLILLQLVGAGGESTAGLIATSARRMAEDPVVQARLRSDPALIDPFLDECLRLESPFRGHYRVVTRDTALGGVPLPAGSHLLLLWGAANRDPARFTDPDVLDLDRPGIRQHLAFGKGAHFCVGSSLARMEATAALRLLLDRTEHVDLDPEALPTWVPSIFVRRHRTLPLRFR
ncbi:cytochrome P450 [Nocardioides marmoriginsengisoli]|uniref:Cytochrome P450 n=1 Tax=Nocardioides marmoriginsengisoli TaxID=661483 RepID=A0A3N0CGG2_9ACTN|nr:cytochrome P450 [Nocardioides marmoriginsengisoli]RNL62544.1 cytochrome P450 [Nocardioides marmoriginsengisoli]